MKTKAQNDNLRNLLDDFLKYPSSKNYLQVLKTMTSIRSQYVQETKQLEEQRQRMRNEMG